MAIITGQVEISKERILEIEKIIKSISDFKKEIEQSLQKGATGLVELIFGGAISLEVSDVHIEPQEQNAKIRMRIDGMLQDIGLLPLAVYETLLSRIKLLSGIKLNITQKPQDGRFSIIMEKLPIEIRCSTLPSEHGESLVLRILNPKALINLEDLGLRKDLFETFEKEIKKPNGMIIVTGPTGSGKTTTLYSFLKKIQSPEVKIITIEDPIEYRLEGISQTQVDEAKGYDFASGLRSIMRQDPDAILVGEIRDFETAQIALQASLTGHLVLSTLHTNDAAGTIPRLVDLGVKASSVAPALSMAVAQRLIRKVCQKCAKSITASPEDLNKIKKGLAGLSKNIKIPAFKKSFKILEPKGCKFCNFTGFKGRVGIFETFLVDPEMEKFILKEPSVSEMRDLAIKKGMVTMYQDGLIKVLEGVTTLDEVERITGQ